MILDVEESVLKSSLNVRNPADKSKLNEPQLNKRRKLEPNVSAPATHEPELLLINNVSNIPSDLFQIYHSASFDAYMTGTIFINQKQKTISTTPLVNFEQDYKNKIYLMGKDVGLCVMKSLFSTMSLEHCRKKKIWEELEI
jgi:hypothetical protein